MNDLISFTPIKVIAKPDHIESLSESNAVQAIAELIWNGFDAEAKIVSVEFDFNELEGIEVIKVVDSGNGISFKQATSCFGSIGESWKKEQKYNFSVPLHGQNGKGRFKAFSLGQNIVWNTFYKEDGKLFNYKILGNKNNISEFKVTPATEHNFESTAFGTQVTISNLLKNQSYLISEKAIHQFIKLFAVFLTEFPHLTLSYNGIKINPKDVQVHTKEYDLSEIFEHITFHPIKLTIIEWAIDTDRVINFCSDKGISLHELDLKQKIKAKGFNFTSYLKSKYLQELHDNNILALGDLSNDLKPILEESIATIKDHFRKRLADKNIAIVDQWKQEKIYPFETLENQSPILKAEQEIFDILAVNVQTFLPSFEKADVKSKKFMFKLLAQAITQNPESVQRIINEVLILKKEDQDKLAELLENTSLSSIISSATIVANRLNFLDGLENLLFNKETKKIFTERDQLHKLLENEAWLFHEEFALSMSEQRLEAVLSKHLKLLGNRDDHLEDNSPVLLSDGRTGRIDLMLSKANQPREGQFDYLIVELKRPSVKINDEVIAQIKKYAYAVAEDERFKGVPAKWTFIAISNEFDSYAKREANQRNRTLGQIHDDAELNITIYIKTWAEVIGNARSKLQFINKHLSYEANNETSQRYFQETYEKFIPKITQ